MKLKTKMFKKLISVLCAATIATSCGAPSVGAVSDRELNNVRKNIGECDNLIQSLNQRKAEINQEKEGKMRNLDVEIQDNENFLNGIISLIADGENHEAEYNRLTRSIEEGRRKRTQINFKYRREARNIDGLLREVNTQKRKLEADLKKLIDKKGIENRRAQLNNRLQLTQREQDSVNLWKRIASGAQYHRGGYRNLCWLMTTMNQMNYFGVVDQDRLRDPVQGVQHVIDYYLNSGGRRDDFNGNNMQNDDMIEKYLNHNGISTCKVTDMMTTDGIGENEARQQVANIAVDQIKAHFNAQKPFDRMSPVSICGGSHWITIVDYFEDTGNVVVVDSLNGYRYESKIEVRNINEVIKGRVSPSEERAGFMALDLIFTSNRGLIDKVGYLVSSENDFILLEETKNTIALYF